MDNSGDILQLCRLCLVKNDVNISIFEEQGDIREILQKISSCLPVKVSREDKLPKKICDGCSYKLDMFYEFWNSTANAEKQLLTWLGEAEVNAKLTDGSVPTVAQQMKPTETVVKQEAIDPSDIHTEENDDDKSYMFPQKFSSEEAGSSATATSNEEPPPPKRARRTAAVKAQIAMDPESDDDEDSGEPITKVEDESEESEGEDHEPSFVDVPSTSADDQPGPSGVGKDGAEAPTTTVAGGYIVGSKKTEIRCIPTATVQSHTSPNLSTPVSIATPNATAQKKQYMLVLPSVFTLGYVGHQNSTNLTLVPQSSLPLTLGNTSTKTQNVSGPNILVNNSQLQPTIKLLSNSAATTAKTATKNVCSIPSVIPLTTKVLLTNKQSSVPQSNRATSQNIGIAPIRYFSTNGNIKQITSFPKQTLLATNVTKTIINQVVPTGSQAGSKYNILHVTDKPFPSGYKNPFNYATYKPPNEQPEQVTERINELPKKPKSSQGASKWTCLICSSVKESKQSLIDHYEFHKEEKENPENKNKTIGCFECPACFKMFNSRSGYKRHVKNMHGEKEFFCNECNRNYTDAYSLCLHTFNKHPSASRLYTCCVCKTFTSKFPLNLEHHINSNHKKTEIYKCKVCHETFSSLAWLNDHKIFHTNADHTYHTNKANDLRKYKCDNCNIHFAEERALLRHQRIHLTEGCLCFVCGKTFENSEKLNAHLLIHAGVKKHVCKVCGKSFLKSGTLVAHLRTHTGEKPYKCITCGKCFSQRTPLVIHQRHHTGEKPYVCPTCKKAYVSKSTLTIHRRTCI